MRVIAPCHTHLKLSLPWRQWWRLDQGMTVQQSEDSTSLHFLPDGQTQRRPEPRRQSAEAEEDGRVMTGCSEGGRRVDREGSQTRA